MQTLDTVTRNLRHACRLLLKAPGFTVAAVATLTLGIGANTAIFSLIKTVMWQPLPYGDPSTVIVVWNANRADTTHLSLQEVVSYGDNAKSLAGFGAYMEINANLTGGVGPERVRAALVTAELFELLQVRPFVGRAFATADGRPGACDCVMLGHGLWQRRFGGDPDVVGRSIPVNGRTRTVIGIMPPSFKLPLDYRADRPSEVWLPLVIDRANLGGWGSRSYFGIARLASGVAAGSASG
jgi:putative ABC transport system permease protein